MQLPPLRLNQLANSVEEYMCGACGLSRVFISRKKGSLTNGSFSVWGLWDFRTSGTLRLWDFVTLRLLISDFAAIELANLDKIGFVVLAGVCQSMSIAPSIHSCSDFTSRFEFALSEHRNVFNIIISWVIDMLALC